jgi:hypothetical protein
MQSIWQRPSPFGPTFQLTPPGFPTTTAENPFSLTFQHAGDVTSEMFASCRRSWIVRSLRAVSRKIRIFPSGLHRLLLFVWPFPMAQTTNSHGSQKLSHVIVLSALQW